jgi:hypothetical protein
MSRYKNGGKIYRRDAENRKVGKGDKANGSQRRRWEVNEFIKKTNYNQILLPAIT